MHGVQIEIIDSKEKNNEQEFGEDIIQIITVFSCRLHRKRASQTKKIIERDKRK